MRIPSTVLRLTLRDFIAWLETKEPDERYHWLPPLDRTCAVDQYFTSLRLNRVQRRQLWNRYGGTFDPLARLKPWTFGALLARCREKLAS